MNSSRVIGFDGTGPLLTVLARRVERMGGAAELDDPAAASLVVVEGIAPLPSYLGVIGAEPGRVYCARDSYDYVCALLAEYLASGARGVRVRPPVLNEWTTIGTEHKRRRRLKKFDPIEFDWGTDESVDADVFDGEVSFLADGESGTGRIRVQGHVNPSDGLFHWAGTAYGDDIRRWKDERVREVEVVTAEGASAQARLTDVTQWGTVRLVGVGAPPF